jgi:LmbE family N-acetylglucosaminyl deacetylase
MIDILAFGVHPDDVELGCSGTLLKHIAMGFKVSRRAWFKNVAIY